MKISFCLITLDEERNLRRCLQSCAALADEIIVLDSGSTDLTEKIAREFGARFERRAWPGYVKQKNTAVSLATHEWIFSLDADEELSPGLREEIRRLKTGGEVDQGVAGFDMPRCVFYEGRWIRHGDWYPDRKVRLFRRQRAKFAGGKVHERLECVGRVGSFRGELFHYSFQDAADHQSRCQQYAKLWAEDKFEAGKRTFIFAPLFHAMFRWLRGYIVRGGFLDGWQGRRIALFSARETFTKYRLLHELNRRKSAN